MKNIIKNIFYGNICEAERNLQHLHGKEYLKYIEKLTQFKKLLSPEQLTVFNSLSDARSEFDTIYQEEIYSNGFKTGMCLSLELLDFNPECY